MDSVPLRGGRCYHTTTTREIQCYPHLLAQHTRCKRTVPALQSTRAAVPTIAEDIAAHHGIRVNLTAASATAVRLTAEQPTWMRPRRQRRQSNTISQHADEVHLDSQQEDPSSTLHYQHEHHHQQQQQQQCPINPSQQLLYIPRGFEDVVASEARRLGVLLRTVENSEHVSSPVSTTDATSKQSTQPQQQQQQPRPQRQEQKQQQQQQQQEAQQQGLNNAASPVQHDTQLPVVPLQLPQLPQQPQRQRRHKHTAVPQLELSLPQQDDTRPPTQQQQQEHVLQQEQQQQQILQPKQRQQRMQKIREQVVRQPGAPDVSDQSHFQQPEQHSLTQQQPAQQHLLLQQEPTSAQPSQQHHQQQPVAAAAQALQQLPPPPPPPAAAASEPTTAATAAAAAPAKWQLAVSKRLAAAVDGPAMTLIRQARYSRLRSTSSSSSSAASKPRSSRAAASAGYKQPASAAAAAVGGQLTTAQGIPHSPALPTTEDISTDENLSTAGEGQLCEMYQTYLKLQNKLCSGNADDGDHQQVDRLSLLHEAAAVQSQGLMAQQLLLELYQPMIINRTKRILSLHPDVDERELKESLSRAVLKAAAKFDQNKAGKNAKLSSLAAVYIKNAIRDLLYEYQSAPVVVPYSVRQLSHKLQRVEKQLTAHHGGRAPTDDQLAAALGVPVAKVQEMRQAVAFQSSSLLEAGGDADDDADAAQQSGALNLLTLDVSQSQDELDYIPGAVRYARSGTEEERQLADESRALADVMQRFLLGLEPKDRTLLALRLGLISPDSLPDIAADVINHNNGDSSGSSSTTSIKDSQAVGKTSRKKATRSKKKEKVKKYTSLLAKIPELDEGILLQSLDSIDSLETSEGLSVAELSRLFDMPRQRGHQLMERVVKQMKQQLQETAGSNAELAMLLTAAGSRL